MSTSREIRQALVMSCAEAIMTQIRADMDSEYRNSHGQKIPLNVGSFSCLHDYCDANTYLIDFVPENKPACDCDILTRLSEAFSKPVDISDSAVDHADDCETHIAWDAYMELCNDVSDVVDAMLSALAVALDDGETCNACKTQIRFKSSHIVHIDDNSHMCSPCEFCVSFCVICFARRLDFAGVRDGSIVYACKNGHEFVFARLSGMIQPSRILTVIQ